VRKKPFFKKSKGAVEREEDQENLQSMCSDQEECLPTARQSLPSSSGGGMGNQQSFSKGVKRLPAKEEMTAHLCMRDGPL